MVQFLSTAISSINLSRQLDCLGLCRISMKGAVLLAYQWREIILVSGFFFSSFFFFKKKDPTGFPTQFTAHFHFTYSPLPYPSIYRPAILLLALFFQVEALLWWIVESSSVPQGTEDNTIT
ncbi:hypothetical protein IWW34DRAFT_172709 [Fusarium oxysporum f. sp. albedinis]|nr:hypothetical protein IWW34DRAFT_172709 [Fusarium oxysporum f. sp. albedinis]